MKGIITLFLCCFTCAAAVAAPYRAALVADMTTGRVLVSENASVPNYPASLTKIMTLYLTFDALTHGRLHLDDDLIVSASAAAASPVKLGLSAGSKISVDNAIRALAVVSANDVARVLAENLKGGKEGNFAELMTRVATEIGLSNTHFENSSGLPNDDQLSTARDIALLSMAVYKHFPQYWHYFGIKTWTYNGKTYTNGNRLLGTYPGCDGMKTGFTNKSKYSLVATAKRGDARLLSVVLGAENKDVRANVSTQMLNRGFALVNGGNLEPVTVPTPAPRPVQTYAPAPQPVQTVPAQQPTTFAAAYNAATAQAKPTYSAPKKTATAPGTAGVQFGAFSSESAAASQVANVKNKLGVTASIEPTGTGMYRVRTYGLTDSAAANLSSRATASKIDNYIFH